MSHSFINDDNIELTTLHDIVTDNLQLSATYAYLDTEYKKLDGNYNYRQCKRACRNEGAKPVSIASQEENDFVATL